MTILALAPGNWAEWVGGIGTALAFGATSVAIWQGHRLRRAEHREAMYDEALKVTTRVTQGSKGVGTTGSMVNVTILNGGRREITGVAVTVVTSTGQPVGHDSGAFLQAGFEQLFQFEPVDGIWAKFGVTPAIDALVTLTFGDIDGTNWTREPDGRLLRSRKHRS